MRKILLFTCYLLFSYSGNSQEINLQIEKKLWQEDFKYLKQRVEKIAPMYQYEAVKKNFNSVHNDLLTLDFNGYEAMFSIQKLMNTLNDEGCNVPLFQKGLELQVLPIKTYWFSNGLYVLDATNNYKEIIDKQVIKINNTPIEKVFEKLKIFLNADSLYYKKHLFQVYGFMPSILKTVGLGINDNEVKLEFASGKTTLIKSESINEYVKLNRKLPNDEFFSYTNKNYKGKNYWLDFIPNTKTLFVQLQAVVNNKEEYSFSNFIDKIEENITSNKTDKIIIDVRYGGGGNGFKLKRLTDLLRVSKAINKEGHLFVLTSKATRGALLELVSILNLNTKAILVGEPTAEGVNTVGDIKYITLPNSGLKVSITHTLWATSWKQDSNKTLLPHLKVNYSFTDKKANIDPWIKATEAYSIEAKKKPIPKELRKQLEGKYKVEKRKLRIRETDGKLYLKMSRRIRSFFEISTELYYQSEGILSTDIENVFLKYSKNSSGKIKIETIKWNNLNLKVE
ncbi:MULTISPECIES: hypothetical protein [unclassified Tenacibaculum]|uniref:hypothetical protein n=1 Tax=unclassified Tenacibaculum TaxID=2635139 RepID=UPI001F17BCBD|nr:MULTISPECIES: hypothetical protein [unclassified Tenacibaculum]MCF2875246.1 hypothetical protein [Tenacibaculum sp. Cn5-1]MCF2935322.1 hypothetical protein [Tenacibaculum sp. Cn5-34]MCG7511236.1 hypothetical protein [Tenacibaculum sp. Cn5-46]